MLSRRKFLMASAAAPLALSACTSTGGIDPTVISYIQAAVAAAAQFVPVVESIAATAASIFGPAWSAVVTVGSAAINQIVAALVAAANTLPPAQHRLMRKRLAASTPASPVVIGKTPAGVVVMGYR